MKKIWLITPIIFMLLMLFSSILFLFTNKSILDRDVYLDGFNTKTNTKQKGDIVSFVTDPYDNYAIYKPINNKDTNNINEANFYGNIDSYDYAPENNYKMSMWNNDYQCFQWVIKTNNNFKNIKVSANSSDFDIYNDKNIKLDYGFLDFVYASDNGNNEYVVKQKLLVPEKVTSNKKIINVKQNKVYVVLFRVRTVKTLLNKVNLNLNIKATKEDDSIFNLTKKAELNIDNNKSVKNNNSDVNIFYFPEWNSYYYNNKEISNFSDSEDDKIKYNIPNDYTEWAKNNIKFNNAYNQGNNLDFDYKMYIDYNYNKYWKNAFEYVSNNYGLDWFQLNVSDDYNYHYGNFEYDEKSHTRNPWKFYRKNMNFLNWEYDGDDSYIKFFSASNVDRDFFVNNCINHMKINDKNWEAFDYYLSKCYDSGLRKAMIFSIQNAFNKNVKTLSIFNKNNFFKSLSSVETVQGQELLKWWLNEFKKHIDKVATDSSNPGISKIYNKIKFFYYLDEKSIETSKITNSIIKSFDPEKKYIHLCAALTSKDIDFKDVNSYDRYEYIWVNFLDYYNRSNNDFTKFIANRKKTNLYTGQYSLDSDFTFNLVRSEPGINMYIQQSLVNESGGGSYFLRYLSNGWESGKNYYTSNFKDLKWVSDLGFVYKSGDTLLSYPECDINNDANYNQIHQYDKNENKLSSVDYIPSIRYEMLNEGRKLASKVTELLINNKISNDYLNSNISTLNKFSKRLSVNKFNLDYNLINFKAKPINTSSIIMRLLFQGQRDEITALKNIVNLVKNTK